jgi:hypothetical protein
LDRAGLKPPTQVELGQTPAFEIVFSDIVSGSRAESRARRGIPDDDELDAIESTHPPALINRFSKAAVDVDVVDAAVIEPEPERTYSPPRSNAERSSRVGRRTYPLSDFERSSGD